VAAVKLHTVFITYNRLELTKRAIASYLETVSVPFTATVVDNGSSDGTEEWLEELNEKNEQFIWALLTRSNNYPGFAANRGWELAPTYAKHLHRADNDHIFLPGWCEEVERVFGSGKVGQVGLRTAQEEQYAKSNTGGNCVIRRELWDAGLRWDERTWPELRDQIGPGITEDSLMSPAVVEMGYTWTRVKQPCIQPISPETPDDPDWPYYLKAWADRGIHGAVVPGS
jgi:glycosyltransferase involved in cell wall biosynthesis